MKINFKSACYIFAISFLLVNCTKKKTMTNGETIFKTGKNIQGQTLQDINKSEKKMAHSCSNCHGNDGKGSMMANVSIRYSDLSKPSLHKIPYNDILLIRFIDHELKSDSTIANTGVVWKMNSQDKTDLITYLKQL